MAKTRKRVRYDGLTADEKHKILREAYRNYLTWQDLITYGDPRSQSLKPTDTLTYSVPKRAGSNELVPIMLSFYDLERALKRFKDGVRIEGTVLSKRKEQAFYLHVLRDMKQKDVADIMGITPVTVGQYVEQATRKLSEYYFADDKDT